MKISGIAVLMLGLGLGLLAGRGVAPWFVEKAVPVTVVPKAQKAPEAPVPTKFVVAADKIKEAPAALPAADWAALVQESDTYRRERVLAAYVDTLSAAEIPGIVAKVESRFGPGKESVLYALSGRWVEIDPQAAMAAARKEHLRKGIVWDVVTAFYGDWARRDPAGAVAAAQQLPDGSERGNAAWAIVYQMAESDPASADALLSSVHASNLEGGNHFIYSNWAAKNLEEATRTLLDPAHFSSLGRRYDALGGMIDQLMLVDPRKAGDWVTRLPAGRMHDDAQKGLMERWAKIDPPAAVEWVQSLPDSEAKQTQFQEAIFQWSGHDPMAAFHYVAAMAEGNLKPFLLGKSIEALGQANEAKALAWAQALPPSPEKVVALAAIIKGFALNDPAQTAKLLESMPADAPGATVFPGPADDVYASVATAWVKLDPVATKVWLDGLPAGTRRDAAMQTYCATIQYTHPREATAAAETIGNSSYRGGALMSALQAWVKADRAAGTAAVKASSLSDDQKKEMLEDAPRRPPQMIHMEMWK